MVRIHGINKKGSTSVFMTAILLSMVLVISFFLEAASGLACRSFGEGVIGLASESLLTEYQKTLQKDYGIFAFLGEKEIMESKMNMYGAATFDKGSMAKNGSGNMDLLRMKLKGSTIDLTDYGLVQFDIFEEEIKKYMRYKGAKLIFDETIYAKGTFDELERAKKFPDLRKKEADAISSSLEEVKQKGESDGKETENEKQVKEGKKKLESIKKNADSVEEAQIKIATTPCILKNKSVIDFLPSETFGEDYRFSLSMNPRNEFTMGQYILCTFKNAVSPLFQEQNLNRGGFFENEVEYILIGSKNDSKNLESVKRELMAARLGLNMIHIYGDKIKMGQTASLAASLTPGPWAAVTQFGLIAAWSSIEASNDIKLLFEGKKVPLFKNSEGWAIDLNSLVEGIDANSTYGNGENGLNYKGYLSMLLAANGRENNILRTMDLIQMNIKGTDDETFMIRDYFVGFDYKAQIEKHSGFFVMPEKGIRTGNIEGSIRY